MLRALFTFFSHSLEESKVAVAKFEQAKLAGVFCISRTGTEHYERIRENPLEDDKQIPEVFRDVYMKNKLSDVEYARLDDELISARANARSMSDYRQKAEQLQYANCTTLACFLHESLKERGIESKIFSMGGGHHFVISEHDSKGQIVVSDPWARVQFTMPVESPTNDLANLSITDRLSIAERYSKETNLYVDYKDQLQSLLDQDPDRDATLEEIYTKAFFEIVSSDRFFEFDERPTPNQ